MIKHRISIDPGITGTGIALWPDSTWGQPATNPMWLSILSDKTGSPWHIAATRIGYQLEVELSNWRIIRAYCELPKTFDSAVGRAASVGGSIVKLSYLIGVFGAVCDRLKIPIELIDVNAWKGQLPKSVVEKRIRELLPNIGELGPKSHEWDAIGIGLYAQGFKLDA